MRIFMGRVVSWVFLVVSMAAAPAAWAQSGAVRGRVTGPDGAPMPGVAVSLRNDITGFKTDTLTSADGTFQFFNVPFNPYDLRTQAQGFKPWRRSVEVRSAAPTPIDVALDLATVSETVNVTAEPTAAQLETGSSTSHIDIDKSYIARAPATIASRAMEELVTATPGFAKDENGRFHFQGFHSQGQYVIDGQTVSDQTGVTFSNSIDPGIAQSMEVIYGNVPAEYGEKIGTVISLATKSGLGTPFHGDLYGGGARFATYEGGGSVGGGSKNFGLYASVNGSWSNRFLDPVNFANLNNDGNTQRGFLRLDYASDDLRDQLRFTALVGRTHRDVPNTFSQQAAGQDETVQSRDQNYNLGWTHVLSPRATFEAAGFARLSAFHLLPSANDTPVTAISDRTLDNYGGNAAVTWAAGHHDFKAGAVLKRFPIDEHFSFGLTDPALNDPD
ncbi:MAG TPA: TonB-dependent receptor, partial [Vicinamibacteria bacterium]|nr:TonB-dependent receptor [Vicinamibacteria bacterium]